MSSSSNTLDALRRMLSGRFPSTVRKTEHVLPTGIRAVDAAAGGLPGGAVTEFVCAVPSCGGQLALSRLLSAAREQSGRAALVDGQDAFDPRSHPADLLAHLVWVRCRSVTTALAATDLLLRDANLALVLLDIRDTPASGLRQTPDTQWYRLQRAAEQSALPLVVFSPRPLVPSARLRFLLERPHTLAQLDAPRAFLGSALPATIQRRRLQEAVA